MQDLALDRVPLDFANQRLRYVSTDCHLDDGALGLNVTEHLVEVARVERERLGVAAVSVDDGGNLSMAAKCARGALSLGVASVGVKRNCCHCYSSFGTVAFFHVPSIKSRTHAARFLAA